MGDLFKAEMIRFRFWTLAAAAVHGVILGFLTRIVDLGQQPLLVYQVFAGVYAVAGLLLGLYQMGNYRRPNTWLQLLHRPVAPWRIAAAVGAAGGLMALLAVGLPVFLTALGQHLLSARVVDGRHYEMALAATSITICGYLAGAYAMLGGGRHSVTVLALPTLLIVNQASGVRALVVQCLLVLFLATLVGIAFRPDRGVLPRHPVAAALTVFPVLIGALVMFRLLFMGFEMGWIALGTHPLNSTPPPGSFIEARNGDSLARFEAGLGAGNDDSVRRWREQVRISEVVELDFWPQALPRRHQMTNPAPLEFDDPEARLRWAFSHDSMRFHGVRLADGQAAGELGIGDDAAPLPGPALPIGGDWVATAEALYEYDAPSRTLWPRLAVPAGETISGAEMEPLGDRVALLSDRALYFFDARDLAEGHDLLAPQLRVPWPGPVDQLIQLDAIELLDGYLVSFLFGKNVLFGEDSAYQDIIKIPLDQPVETVAHRELTPNGPALWRYQHWWPSPVLRAVIDRAENLLAAPARILARPTTARPALVRWTAATLLLVSLLIASWWVQRLPLGRTARWAWVLACGVLGLPALISLWLLVPERLETQPIHHALPSAT